MSYIFYKKQVWIKTIFKDGVGGVPGKKAEGSKTTNDNSNLIFDNFHVIFNKFSEKGALELDPHNPPPGTIHVNCFH